MITLERLPENPIVMPNKENIWERNGAFNGCVNSQNGVLHLVYRALSAPQIYHTISLNLSSIGYAKSSDGIHFQDHTQLIKPEEDWELFGCEDPRITYMDGTYFIFYTALSTYPFIPEGIKIGVAKTADFKTLEKHLVTSFNSKAMALFPERIEGKLAALLTVHTDIPPAKIALATFDKTDDIWSKEYWDAWYARLSSHVVPLLRGLSDQLELGAPPLKTEYGWLLIYSYIMNYFKPTRTFGIEAVLLDFKDPQKVIGRTKEYLMTPETDYEQYGNVPNIVFPSGAVIRDGKLLVYYGAADTSTCIATCDINALLKEIQPARSPNTILVSQKDAKLKRFEENPIISPIPEIPWESRATFNPAALYADGKIHLLYRAMSQDNTSVLGYAQTSDGVNIDERLPYPIYTPRADFEKKTVPMGNSGCEDSRLTQIGDSLYMCYTAFDGTNPPRVALTSLHIDDFLGKLWRWATPKLISPPGVDDKDACILPKKIDGKYIIFHRIGFSIWIDACDDLEFQGGKWIGGEILANPRIDKWDNVKIGISTPPLETEKGWFLLYHGVSGPGKKYKVGAMLLDLHDPRRVLGRTNEPLLEPEMPYELTGEVPNVVFPCGAVVIGDILYVYYGAADKVVGVAGIPFNRILSILTTTQ